jgi:transcriptional regulator with XRE-family HTH domain/rubredoxin
MDLRKIGRFIAAKRQENNYTQESLAEALDVSNRSVSKWERGICLPDSGHMAELCKLLKISINDLFNGEKVDMKDANKKSEQLLIEMTKRQEANNKRAYANICIVAVGAMLLYFTVIGITARCMTKEDFWPILIVVAATLILLITFFFAFRTEVDLGHYACKHCGHKFTPTYGQAARAIHVGTTRYLKCPKCHKRSWSKKHF